MTARFPGQVVGFLGSVLPLGGLRPPSLPPSHWTTFWRLYGAYSSFSEDGTPKKAGQHQWLWHWVIKLLGPETIP